MEHKKALIYHPDDVGKSFTTRPESWEKRKEDYVKKGDLEIDPSAFNNTLDILEAIFNVENTSVRLNGITQDGTVRRSLSVGDVVVLDDTPYEVGRMGYRNIDGQPTPIA